MVLISDLNTVMLKLPFLEELSTEEEGSPFPEDKSVLSFLTILDDTLYISAIELRLVTLEASLGTQNSSSD